MSTYAICLHDYDSRFFFRVAFLPSSPGDPFLYPSILLRSKRQHGSKWASRTLYSRCSSREIKEMGKRIGAAAFPPYFLPFLLSLPDSRICGSWSKRERKGERMEEREKERERRLFSLFLASVRSEEREILLLPLDLASCLLSFCNIKRCKKEEGQDAEHPSHPILPSIHFLLSCFRRIVSFLFAEDFLTNKFFAREKEGPPDEYARERASKVPWGFIPPPFRRKEKKKVVCQSIVSGEGGRKTERRQSVKKEEEEFLTSAGPVPPLLHPVSSVWY